MTKIAVVGSRTYPHTKERYDKLDENERLEALAVGVGLVRAVINAFPTEWEIISGGAKGPDSWGVDCAAERGMQTTVIRPDWGLYGRGAGFRRNKEIVEKADEVLAFWDGESKGTQHTIKYAVEQTVPIHVIGPDGEVWFQITKDDYKNAGGLHPLMKIPKGVK